MSEPDDDGPEVHVIESGCLHCVISHVVTHYVDNTKAAGETVSWEKIVSNLLQVVAEIVVSRPPEQRDKIAVDLPQVLALQLKEARKAYDQETARIEKAAYTHPAPKGKN